MKLPPGHVPGLVSQHKATAYGGFGQKLLEKMGWEKGQGLGKEKDGMKEAIEVKKKEDTLGVRMTAVCCSHQLGLALLTQQRQLT
jgi:hypothetical protein